MNAGILLDTGPLVAMLNRRDIRHEWTARQLAYVRPPLLTCEAVLTEACHLLRNVHGGRESMLALLRRGVLAIAFRLDEHVDPVMRLMMKYADLPISFADACLIRMSELYPDHAVMTLDGDFRVYRKFGRQAIPLLMPK